MAIVFLGLGSNLGDRAKYLSEAAERLSQRGVRIIKHSTIIETDPVGGPPQGLFLNAVVKAVTALTPRELLRVCQETEAEMGRVRLEPNGPRVIDIDVLLYDHLRMDEPDLQIPHPRMLEREFVMVPLKEIEPEWEKVVKPL